MDGLGGLVWDQNFQSLFLSPLIGAVMGTVLAWLTTRPADQQAAVNVSYIRVVNVFNTTVHYHGAGTEDRGATLLIGAVVAFGSAWLYVEHGPEVLQVVTSLAGFVLCASLTFVIKKRLIIQSGEGWLFHLFWPAVVSVLSYVLILQATEMVNDIASEGMTFHNFRSLFWINTKLFYYILYQALGLVSVVLALCTSGVALLHQIALGGLTDPENIYGFRGELIRRTRRLGGPIAFLVSIAFLVVAWMLISGQALRLISGS
jgi:hypothetical protein